MANKTNLQNQVNQLEEIVRYFEETNQDFNLDAGLEKYDQAMAMVQEIKDQLQSYELKIKEIQLKYSQKDSEEE